jgi:hypothetical protein
MPAPAPHDGAVQRIAELETRLEALSARLAALESNTRGPRDDADDAELLHVLAEHVGQRSFKALDLLHHAAVTPRLHAALLAADLTTVGGIGCWLRRVAARGPASGLRIVRQQRTKRGRQWVILCR